jgi:DNA polymerase-3 subunit gamma/tau
MLWQEIRPPTFNDVVGNTSTVKSLQAICKRKTEDRPHTFLFKGPKGCGKTTLARILAKEFGTRPDNVHEVNAANVRGIDGVRTIEEEIQFLPIGGGSVTYILDEAHRLTKDAMSALLKITEDTPAHVYFIFCTTDPEQLLPTLKNRCTEYTVEPLKQSCIMSILERACKEKNLNVDASILDVIATNCDRTPRTALEMLDKVYDLIDLDEIADVLVSEIEIKDGGDFIQFCKLLLLRPDKRKSSWKRVLNEFYKLDNEPEQIKAGVITFMRKQLMNLGEADIEYASDIVRTMNILIESNTFYGKQNALVCSIMKICLGDYV